MVVCSRCFLQPVEYFIFNKIISRSLCVDATLEQLWLFAGVDTDDSYQRPDIVVLLRNPRGFGRHVILDMAVTGIDDQSRISSLTRFQFFSHTIQINESMKRLITEHIRHK